MTVIRKHLFAAAQLVDDLVEDTTKLPKKTAHVTKDTEVSAEALAEAHKLINKAKMQKAHPNGKKGGKADAEGDVVPRKDRTNLKNGFAATLSLGLAHGMTRALVATRGRQS